MPSKNMRRGRILSNLIRIAPKIDEEPSATDVEAQQVATVPEKQEDKPFYNWEEWDPMTEDYNSSKNTLALKPDKDPLSSITGQNDAITSKLGKVNLCDHYLKYGECADGKFCDRYHVEPHVRDQIRAMQETTELNKNRTCMNYTFLSPIEIKPDPSTRILVSVTNAPSPVNFYLIAPFETLNFKGMTDEEMKEFVDRVEKVSSVKVKLQRLHDQLAALFDHPYRIDNLNDEIYLSQIVACKLRDNRTFRRAIVLETPNLCEDKFNYRLRLLDVGAEVELAREHIYDIKAHCLSDPPLAWNCRLDIRPANGQLDWSAEAITFFKTKVRADERYYLCEVKEYLLHDEIFTIDLYHPSTKESLTDLMITSGYAEKCPW